MLGSRLRELADFLSAASTKLNSKGTVSSTICRDLYSRFDPADVEEVDQNWDKSRALLKDDIPNSVKR